MSRIPTRKNIAPPPKKRPGNGREVTFGMQQNVVHGGVGRARVRVLPSTVPETVAERRRQMVKASEAKLVEEERAKTRSPVDHNSG